MPLVRVRILDGKTQLAAPSRPFAEDSSLQHVVDKALEPFPDCSVTVLDVFPDAAEVSMKKSQFFSEDFKDIKLSDVAAMGFFWVAHVTRDGLSKPAAMAGPGLGSTSGSSSSSSGMYMPEQSSWNDKVDDFRGCKHKWECYWHNSLKAYKPRKGASNARLPCYEQNEQT